MHPDRQLWTTDGAKRMVRLKSAVMIGALGDGTGLGFGEHDNGFESRTAFASAHDGRERQMGRWRETRRVRSWTFRILAVRPFTPASRQSPAHPAVAAHGC